MSGLGDGSDQEAAVWLARLQSRSISTAELEEFWQWRRDPAKDAAYARAEALWENSARLSNDPDILEALHGKNADRTRRSRAAVSWPTLALVGMATATAMVIVSLSFRSDPSTLSYQTAVGERSTVQLPDGSKLQLDTDSAVATRFDTDQRRITLSKGQAYFQVAHAATRPFVVDAGDGVTITATGTQFDVQRASDRIVVALVEGSVIVRRGVADLATMKAGTVLEVAIGNGVIPTKRTPIETTGWRNGHLTFRDTPLADAVAQINRYTESKLEIRKAGATSEPISGEFSTDDPEGFKRGVNALLGEGTVGN